ncbi:MAG: zinc ribbon domain-containing protein [Methanolinea sp.]|nr:zinc ribbon domain-containing protein [Methanolinea sp.]
MNEKNLHEITGKMMVPREFLMPLFEHLNISPSALFHFFSIGQVQHSYEIKKAIVWWNSKTKEDQARYLTMFQAIGKPEKITRLVSVQYFDQIYTKDLFSAENTPEDTIFSLSLSSDGRHVLFDDSKSRIDYLNAGIGFLATSEMPQNLETAGLLMEKDALIAFAGIIDFLQNSKYLQAVNHAEPSHTLLIPDLKKFLLGFEGMKDTRWFTPLVFITFPYNPAMCRELDWSRALTQLHSLDVIEYSQNENKIELTPYGIDFCYSVARSVKRLAIISLENKNQSTVLLNNCLLIRTWNRVWAISPALSSEQVSLATIEPVILFKLLDELIIPRKPLLHDKPSDLSLASTLSSHGEVRKASDQIKVPDTCTSCHAPLPPNAKFCRKCGKPVQIPDQKS